MATLTPIRQGKVRDLYELTNGNILLVATDRVSAFDSILPTAITGKGAMLTKISGEWFRWLSRKFPQVKTHFVTDDIAEMAPEVKAEADRFAGRSVEVRRAKVYAVEFVVRGYITGSGWSDYKKTGKVQGIDVGAGLRESDRLAEPIFTPTTKEEGKHDEPLTWEQYQALLGEPLASKLRDLSIAIYDAARLYAEDKGILLADTKFEWGHDGAKPIAQSDPILIDEVLTPDSSRYWDAATWTPGKTPHSFDKQFVRDYLKSVGWSGAPPAPPALPAAVVTQTLERYQSAHDKLFG
jgi:phosphoribosylaminoimidazole-succinocarboxamide synthase